MATSYGQKVTTDPASKQASLSEAVGMVTNDSLAAESMKRDGSFGEGNTKAGVSPQPSKSTTTNNTDTSNARKLAPATDAEARDVTEGRSETQQLNAGASVGKENGVGPTYAVNTSQSGPTGGAPNSSAGTVAGGYAGAADQARDAGEFKPKGKNLTESENLEGKTAFGDIGTENDPSRAAEQNMQKRDAMPGAAAGMRDTSAQAGESKFSTLGEERA